MCCADNVLPDQSTEEVLKPVARVLFLGYLSVHKRQEAVHFSLSILNRSSKKYRKQIPQNVMRKFHIRRTKNTGTPKKKLSCCKFHTKYF